MRWSRACSVVGDRWFYATACHQCDCAYGLSRASGWPMAMTMAHTPSKRGGQTYCCFHHMSPAPLAVVIRAMSQPGTCCKVR
ncbi:hypothetical protein VO63_22125 [Streptomyces showdoensis]|uniref:Uncharacterized protein n=1 Tax=Streptomyces showdoensis TaxID=68268 RepID=A0A2P2GJM9_STREW|nr:hypothetical protein VO63_22125 [Streptomyces showdoensis]